MRYLRIAKLPSHTTSSSIQENLYHEFKKYGKLYSLAIKDETNNGRDERYAILCYASQHDALNASEAFKGKRFMGQTVTCEQINSSQIDTETYQILTKHSGDDHHIPRSSRTLFIGNLPADVKDKELADLFKKFGHIIDIEIKANTHYGPAFAFMQFAKFEAVTKAIKKMDGHICGEQRIKCGYGKTVMHRCMIIDTVPHGLNTRTRMEEFMSRYHFDKIQCDKKHKQALIWFTTIEACKNVVFEFKNRIIYNNEKIKVDYASDHLIRYIQDRIEDTNKRDREGDRTQESSSSNSNRDRKPSSAHRESGSRREGSSSEKKDRRSSSSKKYRSRESSREASKDEDRNNRSRRDRESSSKHQSSRSDNGHSRSHRKDKDRRDRTRSKSRDRSSHRDSKDKDRDRDRSDRSRDRDRSKSHRDRSRDKSRSRDRRSRDRSRHGSDRNHHDYDHETDNNTSRTSSEKDDERFTSEEARRLEIEKQKIMDKLKRKEDKKMKSLHSRRVSVIQSSSTSISSQNGLSESTTTNGDVRDVQRVDLLNSSPNSKSNMSPLIKNLNNDMHTTHEENTINGNLTGQSSNTQSCTTNLNIMPSPSIAHQHKSLTTATNSTTCSINIRVENGNMNINATTQSQKLDQPNGQQPPQQSKISPVSAASVSTLPNSSPVTPNVSEQPAPYQPTAAEQEYLNSLPPKRRSKYLAQLANKKNQTQSSTDGKLEKTNGSNQTAVPTPIPQPKKQSPDEVRQAVFRMLESKEKWSVKDYKMLSEDLSNIKKELIESRIQNNRPANGLSEAELKALDPSYVPIKSILKPFTANECSESLVGSNLGQNGEIFKAFCVEPPSKEMLQKRKEENERLALRSGNLGRLKEKSQSQQNQMIYNTFLQNDTNYNSTLKELENIMNWFEYGHNDENATKPPIKQLPQALEIMHGILSTISMIEEDLSRLKLTGIHTDFNNNSTKAFYWNRDIAEKLQKTKNDIAKEIEATWMLKPENLISQDTRNNKTFGTFYNWSKIKEFRNAVLSRFNVRAVTLDEELKLKEIMNLAEQKRKDRKQWEKIAKGPSAPNPATNSMISPNQSVKIEEREDHKPHAMASRDPRDPRKAISLQAAIGLKRAQPAEEVKVEEASPLPFKKRHICEPNPIIPTPSHVTKLTPIARSGMSIVPKKIETNPQNSGSSTAPNTVPQSLGFFTFKDLLINTKLQNNHPCLFRGNILLKKTILNCNFHYVSGNKKLASNTLRIQWSLGFMRLR